MPTGRIPSTRKVESSSKSDVKKSERSNSRQGLGNLDLRQCSLSLSRDPESDLTGEGKDPATQGCLRDVRVRWCVGDFQSWVCAPLARS